MTPSKSVGRRRLMALGDYVEKMSKDRKWRKYFRMDQWLVDIDGAVEKLGLQPDDVVPVNGGCGTAGCLLGHTPNVPMLKRAGVSTVLRLNGLIRFTLKGERIDINDLTSELFGIDERSADRIFVWADSTRNLRTVTPMQAVRQLRKIVKDIDAEKGWAF